MMIATAAALALANSPMASAYEHVLHTEVGLHIGPLALNKTAVHWVNDGLMSIFFFTVGLEIKREVFVGDLSQGRAALLPVLAAVGGMVVPAAIFAALNAGGPGQSGWGVPMATDIAFALGVLALLGRGVPRGLLVFLTALAIVDDIGAVLVIAFFYADQVSFVLLGAAAGLLVVSSLANALGLRHPAFYLALGVGVWLCFLESGVHATLAAVLMAFTIPARTRIDRRRFADRLDGELREFRADGLRATREMLTHDEEDHLEEMNRTLERATAPLQRFESLLTPLVTYLVLPAFALCNAGVRVDDDLLTKALHPVAAGAFLGLVVGKQVGIFGASWLAVKVAQLPRGVGWRALYGAAALGGIGFTMALFVGELAFTDPTQTELIKVGVLAASFVSAAVGIAMIHFAPAREPEAAAAERTL